MSRSFVIVYDEDSNYIHSISLLIKCIEAIRTHHPDAPIIIAGKFDNQQMYISTLRFTDVNVYTLLNNNSDIFTLIHLIINVCETTNYVLIHYNMILNKPLPEWTLSQTLVSIFHDSKKSDRETYDIADLLEFTDYNEFQEEEIANKIIKHSTDENPYPVKNLVFYGNLEVLKEFSADLGIHTEFLQDLSDIQNEDKELVELYFACAGHASLAYQYCDINVVRVSLDGEYVEYNLNDTNVNKDKFFINYVKNV